MKENYLHGEHLHLTQRDLSDCAYVSNLSFFLPLLFKHVL